ncbi:MAG: HAD family hydrolase, partial [Streptosporangiaceae bacterium]
GAPSGPYAPAGEHDEAVPGNPRAAGPRACGAPGGTGRPHARDDDPPSAETIHGLGTRKNEIVLRRIREDGVEAYESSVRYVRAARDAGLCRAVVSSSANCRDVLVAAGIEDLFEARIDGVVAGREHLRGKPAPDTFLAAARALGLGPQAAAVFEDALAGVEAGRAGSFRFVVGVDRTGQADALKKHGADVVVADLAELLDQS